MTYEATTAYIIEDFERKSCALTESEPEDPQVKFNNIVGVVSIVAANFIFPDEFPTHGQIAQSLSDWHRELAETVSAKYEYLTKAKDGPCLTREEANTDPNLRMLQAIRQGVRRSMNSNYRIAQKLSNQQLLRLTDEAGYPEQLFQ